MGMIRPRSRSPITTSQSKKREASKREKDTSNSMERKPKRRMYKKSERENEDKQDNKPIVQSQPSGLVSKLRNIFYGGKDK